jgi:hypothetical protein
LQLIGLAARHINPEAETNARRQPAGSWAASSRGAGRFDL